MSQHLETSSLANLANHPPFVLSCHLFVDLLKSTSLTWGSPKSAAFLAKATTCTAASMVEYRNLEVNTYVVMVCICISKRRAFTLLAGNSCCSYLYLYIDHEKHDLARGKKTSRYFFSNYEISRNFRPLRALKYQGAAALPSVLPAFLKASEGRREVGNVRTFPKHIQGPPVILPKCSMGWEYLPSRHFPGNVAIFHRSCR